MIVVDTSALLAILLDEPDAQACRTVLESEEDFLISAATVSEALIVAERRGIGEEMDRLVVGFGFEIVSVTSASARRVARAYRQWGKGIHPAGLNWGDCFSYALAKERGARLLYVGADFGRTDIGSALGEASA